MYSLGPNSLLTHETIHVEGLTKECKQEAVSCYEETAACFIFFCIHVRESEYYLSCGLLSI